MKVSKLLLGSLFAAGPLCAALIQNNTGLSGIGLTPTFTQTFATPSAAAGSQVTPASPANSTSSTFQYLSVGSNDTGLYYDPAGIGACMNTKAVAGGVAPSLANQTPNITGGAGCLSNFTIGSGGTQVANDALGNPTTGTLPTLSLLFNSPQYAVAFILATNANGTLPNGQPAPNTLISVYDASNTLLESDTVHTSMVGGNNFFTISGDGAIGSVVISSTGLNETGQNGNATATQWAALVTNVEGTTTPEPGTIGLFGLGLAAVVFVKMREKA